MILIRRSCNPRLFGVPIPNVNIYGIPWIIGAKKGFPNFNEFSMQSISQFTRKLQIDKHTLGSDPTTWATNQMYVIGVSNIIGAEFWNSYSAGFPRRRADLWRMTPWA